MSTCGPRILAYALPLVGKLAFYLKNDLLKRLGVAILWTSYFAQCIPTRWRNSFFYLLVKNGF